MSADTLKQNPPGPTEAMDLNIHESFFPIVANLLAQYPDIVYIKSKTRKSDSFILNHPDHVRHVMIRKQRNYAKGLGFERVKLMLGNGIIVSDGDFWHRQRRMMQPAFRKSVIEKLCLGMVAENRPLVEQWQALAGTGEAINISQVTSHLSLNTMLKSLFSEDLAWFEERHGHNPFAVLADDSTRDMQLAVKFHALRKDVMALIIKRREQSLTRFDLLAMLMAARDDEDRPMEDKAIEDEVMTLIVAGHETTAATLNWLWYLLSQHPDIEEKCYREAAALGQPEPGFADLGNLGFTRQAIDEALRLYPPVWMFARKALTDDQIGDFFIPAGSDIFIAPYFLHRHESFWSQPESFDPQRFAKDKIRQRPAHAYIPFSAGPRRCIGDFFSIVEILMHLALMLPRFTLHWDAREPIALDPNVNLRTRHDLYMTIEHRTR